MHPDGYESLEVEQEIRDGSEDVPDEYVRLPKAPHAHDHPHLESFDREVVICEHELARALEAFLTKQPVRLYDADIEFQAAAQRVLELAHEQKCDLKGR